MEKLESKLKDGMNTVINDHRRSKTLGRNEENKMKTNTLLVYYFRLKSFNVCFYKTHLRFPYSIFL